MTNDASNPPTCASCYWFLTFEDAPSRCCCAGSFLYGNTVSQLTCNTWKSKDEPRVARSSAWIATRIGPPDEGREKIRS